MSYQVRRSADVSHSARAIAAADAGVECMLYQMFSVSVDNGVEAKNACNPEGTDGNFKNGASFEIELPVGEGEDTLPRYFVSRGKYQDSVRSIRLDLNAR